MTDNPKSNSFLQALRALVRLKPKQKLTGRYLLSLVIAVVLALLIGAGIMLLCGCNPLDGYAALLKGALGKTRSLGNTLEKTATLALTGLAMCLAAKAGIFNVGGEGQLLFGAVAAAVVGANMPGPGWLVILCAFLSALIAGGAFAYIPGALKVHLGVDEVITTIMFNSAAAFFCSYLATGPLKTTEKGIAVGTAKITVTFPKLIRLSNLTTGIFISAGIALLVWYLMNKTTVGFEMKLTGENDTFARYGGISTKKLMIWSMVFSGAICGAVGMLQVFGLQGRFVTNISDEFYFDGMLVAMIMRYDPLGTILMSFFFGILEIGGQSMQSVGVATEVIDIVQSVIIFFMAAEGGIRQYFSDRSALRHARALAQKEVQ